MTVLTDRRVLPNGHDLTEPMMRAAITGGSGFIGTNLVERYAAASVFNIKRDISSQCNIRIFCSNSPTLFGD
jgi:hypothetical protein